MKNSTATNVVDASNKCADKIERLILSLKNSMKNDNAKNINDEKDNKTRFVLVSRSKTKSTNCDKTSIAFATKNQSGALVKVLNVFDSLNINLLYIDSRPSKKNLGEYVFFVDFEGHIDDVPTQKVLDLIKLNTTFIKILGSYKKN